MGAALTAADDAPGFIALGDGDERSSERIVEVVSADRIGAQAETGLARSSAAGELMVDAPTPADWARIAELCAAYVDLPLGLVDASAMATAERLNATTLATLDHRHFTAVRPAHVDALTLVP